MHHLQELLREANYDDALDLINGCDLCTFHHTAGNQLDRLRLICMAADVLDYGGKYLKAEQVIQDEGKRAYSRLSTIRSPSDLDDLPYNKQECWSLLMWGMCFYRRQKHTEALKYFLLAKEILETLKTLGMPVTGSRSRAFYCIALVHRQKKEYSAAQAAFGRSVDLAGVGVAQCIAEKKSAFSYDYHMARCYGLGISWIAYDESFLDQAKSALVIARRMLVDKRVRFIRSYVEVVHACVQMSANTQDVRSIDRAIELLKKAYGVLSPEDGKGHKPYALRAAVELAQAYLRGGRVTAEAAEKENNFNQAESYLKKVIPAAKDSDRRTYCAALIIQSRILRERGRYDEALEVAERAKQSNYGITFSRIDAAITVGEALYKQGEYDRAASEFLEALDLGGKSRKVAAVCHLHLARVYTVSNNPSKVLEHWHLWEAIEPVLQNDFIASLAKVVRVEMGAIGKDFRIAQSESDLTASVHEKSLHKWLASTARSRTNDDAKRAARLLGIGENTLRNWEKSERSSADEENTKLRRANA